MGRARDRKPKGSRAVRQQPGWIGYPGEGTRRPPKSGWDWNSVGAARARLSLQPAPACYYSHAMKTVPQVAEELAKAHVQEDPGTTDVYFVEGVDDEVRLVEVSGSLGNGGPGEVLPVRFEAHPGEGVPYPSVVVLLSHSEWESVANDRLKLPPGWEKSKLKKVV